MIHLRRWAWCYLLLLFSFTSFYSSGINTGTSHDKLKYLGIAWQMFQNTHYLIPEVNGAPYLDKPPLLFWLMVMFWHIFGINMFAMQCLITSILISWGVMSRMLYATIFKNDFVGKDCIPYVLLGSYAIWKDMWFLRVDLLLVTGVLLCNLGIFKMLAGEVNRNTYISIVIGGCIGLFAKGPVAYLFTLLPFLISAFFETNYRHYLMKIISAFLLATLIFFLSWIMPIIVMTKYDFFKPLTDRAGYTDKSYFIYVYEYIPTLFLPWVLNLIFVKKINNVIRQTLQFRAFMVAIFIVNIVVFSFFGQKSMWYLLPLLPFGAIFFTRFFVSFQKNAAVNWLNRGALSCLFFLLGIFCASTVLFPAVQGVVFKNFGGHFSLSFVTMLFFSIISFITSAYLCFSKRDLVNLIAVSSMMFILIYGLMNCYFFPFEQEFTKINQVGNFLQEQNQTNNGIALYRTEYPGQFTYVGRLTEALPRLTTPQSLKIWLQQHPQGVVIFSGKKCPEINNLQQVVFYQERLGEKNAPYLFCQR